jgi:hypothetical protein
MAATLNLGMRDVNWSKDPIWVEYETDLIAAAEATEPNLSLYAKILKNGAFLTELNAPYDLNTAKTDFDLSGLSLVYPQAPADAAINAYGTGILDHVTCKIKMSFADMYGVPAAKPTTLADSSEKVVIYGSTPYWYGIGNTGKDVVLHSYYDARGYDAIKEIRKSQPEFVYIYSHSGTAIPVEYEVFYTDGTNDSAAGTAIPVTAGKVSWVNVGWDAVNMDAIANPAKTLSAYQVRFTLNGQETILIYAIDDHDTEYDEYILFDNGIGGCEVVRCSGRHKIGMEGDKPTVQMSRVRGRSYKDGFRKNFNTRGAEVWQMQTGYQNEYYIRHLSQLFLAEHVWYIDTFRSTFSSVTIKENSATLIDKSEALHNVGFTMVFDNKPAITTFGI